MRATVLIL